MIIYVKKNVIKIYFVLIFILVISLQITCLALPQSFIPSMVLGNSDVNINKHFDSALDIQEYLIQNKSVLSKQSFLISLENDDDLITSLKIQIKPDYLQPSKILSRYTYLSAAELIWGLSQGGIGNGCHIIYVEICINNKIKPVDPALLITLIQKESGLIYGKNATRALDADLQFIMDRATGYYCFENPNKSKSCYDENPNWKYFKGFFRQVYFATRFLRLWSQRCELGGKYAFKNSQGVYVVDSTITINNQSVLLQNGITCAMYIYTPHISAQKLVYSVYKSIPLKIPR